MYDMVYQLLPTAAAPLEASIPTMSGQPKYQDTPKVLSEL